MEDPSNNILETIHRVGRGRHRKHTNQAESEEKWMSPTENYPVIVKAACGRSVDRISLEPGSKNPILTLKVTDSRHLRF